MYRRVDVDKGRGDRDLRSVENANLLSSRRNARANGERRAKAMDELRKFGGEPDVRVSYEFLPPVRPLLAPPKTVTCRKTVHVVDTTVVLALPY